MSLKGGCVFTNEISFQQVGTAGGRGENASDKSKHDRSPKNYISGAKFPYIYETCLYIVHLLIVQTFINIISVYIILTYITSKRGDHLIYLRAL